MLNDIWTRGHVCTGALPAAWADKGAFPSLSVLNLTYVPLTGALPASWGLHSALPSLTALWAYHTQLSGTLPTELGGMQTMQELFIWNNSITGEASRSWERVVPCQLGSCCTCSCLLYTCMLHALRKPLALVFHGHLPCLIPMHTPLSPMPDAWLCCKGVFICNHSKP